MAVAKEKYFFDDDLITCGICHNEMEDARSLLCLHTYCLECLREWNKHSKNEIMCPVCREPTPLTKNRVDGLRKNFLVTKLKDRKDVKITCTSCDASDFNEAVARCLECDEFLCPGCHKTHKAFRLTKNYTVLTLEELRTNKHNSIKSTDRCQDHGGKILSFYCKSCDKPICINCAIEDHQSNFHELVKIKEATVEQREEIQRLVRLCKVKKEAVDEGLNNIHYMRNLDSLQSVANQAIDERIAQVKRSLEKQTSCMKSRVSELIHSRKMATSTYEDVLQILNSRLVSALDMASNVTSGGSDGEVAYVYKHLTASLHEVGQTTTPAIDLGHVRFMEIPKTSVEESIGYIEEKKITYAGRVGINKNNWNASWKLERTFCEDQVKCPYGVATNENGDVVVGDEDDVIKVFNIESGKLEMCIDTKQSLGLLSKIFRIGTSKIVIVHQGNYVVTNSNNLTYYNMEGKYIRQIQLRRRNIAAIAIDSKGHLLVGYSDVKSLDRFADGEQITSLDIPFPAKCIAFSNSTDDKILIINYTEGCRVIDSNGQTIHELRPPRGFTSACYHTGMCTIGKGDDEEVFTFYNTLSARNKVCRFSLSTGVYLGCVTTDLRNPFDIALSVDGKLVVLDLNPACIKVFAPSE